MPSNKQITVTLSPEVSEELVKWIGEGDEIDHTQYVNAALTLVLQKERLAALIEQLEESQ